jgi:drug/metabolite transporter (DMT)-like permease
MKKRLPYLLLTITTVIWGLAFVAQKIAATLPAFTVGALRSILAVLFIFAVIPFFDRLTKNGRSSFNKKTILDFNKRELVGGLVLGILLTVATTLQQTGIGESDSGKAAFITALYVVIVPIVSSIFGKKPGLFAIISVPVAILGFYLLCIKPGETLNPADLLVLGCAIVFAGHIIAVDRLSPGCDGLRMSFIQFAVSFLLNSILALIFEGVPSLNVVISVMPALLFLGIFSSGIAYTLQILGQKGSDPTVASMIMSLEAVFGVLGSAVILKEKMEVREYIGCGVVFFAVLMAQLDVGSIKKLFASRRQEK